MLEYDNLDDICSLVRATLLIDDETPIVATDLLFYGLNFTSMDLLDFLFRVEDRFNVKIPEGTLYRIARGELEESDFAVDGLLTATGREQLMALLFDTPPEVFPEIIHVSTLFRYCTVGSVARLVTHLCTGGDGVRIHPVAGD